jgi:ubiquinone biosynthesis protein COQ9
MQTLLQQALKLAPFEGWTDAMLSRAAEKAGLSPQQMQLCFPHGVSDALEFFAREMDRKMAEGAAALNIPQLKTPQRILMLTRLRFEQNISHRESIRRAQAWYLLPGHASAGLKSMAKTVDEIWHLAGDRSTDFNWYTKRFILGKIYAATLLFWLDDDSEGQAETWAFMERRLRNHAAFSKRMKEAREAVKSWAVIPWHVFLRMQKP